MFYLVKEVHHIKYYYNEQKDLWEGIKQNASTFTYTGILLRLSHFRNDPKNYTSVFSYIKA